MTVTSTEVNETEGPMEVKIPASSSPSNESVSKAVQLIDVPGHFHFKETLGNSIEQAKTIILVIDSADK